MAPAAERAAAALSLPGPTPVRRPEFDVMRGFVFPFSYGFLIACTPAGSIATSRRHRQRLNDTPPAAAPEPHWRRAARYGNEAVLPFYLLHEPVIVAAAWFIVRWNAPVLAQYAALVAISFAATLALYDLAVRRFRPARLLLGMKPRRSAR